MAQEAGATGGATSERGALIGFVAVFDTPEGDGYLGAAMVTDQRGYPLEFRVSTPVRPSAVQRALYGNSLAPFVEAELIGGRLVAELKRRPAVVLANRIGLLSAQSGLPTVFAARADEFVVTSDAGMRYKRLERGDDASRAISLLSDLPENGFAAAIETIEIASRRFDLVDTFDRLKTAIGVLAESDKRYA